MEVTGKNQDECMVALHDCNEDVGRAINFLLESTSDMVNNILVMSCFHLQQPETSGILMLQQDRQDCSQSHLGFRGIQKWLIASLHFAWKYVLV